MKAAGSCEIYCHPGVLQPRYSIKNGTPRPIGIPQESMEAINKFPQQHLHWVRQPVLLTERIGITGPIPRKTSYEDTGGPFYLDSEGERADPIDDDLALWIRTNNGLVICAGCCHSGIVNTVNHIQSLSDESNIRAIIGGFHLLNASSQRLDQTITALRSLELDMVIPCHCTGEHAVVALQSALGELVSPGAAGRICQFF